MLSPFQGLAIRILQAVAHLMQQSIHRALADPVPFASQSFGESRRDCCTSSAVGPVGSPRVTADRVDPPTTAANLGSRSVNRLRPPPGLRKRPPVDSDREAARPVIQFLQPGSHRDARHPRRLKDRIPPRNCGHGPNSGPTSQGA